MAFQQPELSTSTVLIFQLLTKPYHWAILSCLQPASRIERMGKVVKSYKLGPSGGNGGRKFADSPISLTSRVTQVQMRSNGSIEAVQLMAECPDGTSISLGLHGGTDGQLEVFPLDRDEYIVGITGRVGPVVESLQIHTNKKSSMTYGGSSEGSDYQYMAPDGTEIIGFWGRSGEMADSISIIVRQRRSGVPVMIIVSWLLGLLSSFRRYLQ